MKRLKAALLHKLMRWGLILGIVHLGIWWSYGLCAGELPGNMRVSVQTGGFNIICMMIGIMYGGEHDQELPPTYWKWMWGLSIAATVPVALAYAFGC